MMWVVFKMKAWNIIYARTLFPKNSRSNQLCLVNKCQNRTIKLNRNVKCLAHSHSENSVCILFIIYKDITLPMKMSGLANNTLYILHG